MSSEIYELMKRPDEVEVVEKAHRRPAVRRGLRARDDPHGDRALRRPRPRGVVSARQENLETIHKHKRGRERHGLIGELLHEIETGERAARQATMREWLESAPAA